MRQLEVAIPVHVQGQLHSLRVRGESGLLYAVDSELKVPETESAIHLKDRDS
jgi:hypothetical protein